jgi:NAD(P) transhydrogenase subunit alpha
VTKHGVQIVGYTNLASMVAADASALYARNLLDFLKLIITKEGALNIDLADDIVAATLLARDGEVTRKAYKRRSAKAWNRRKAMEVINTVINLIIFVLAIYVGYHVVWNVTPALHTPLMAVTNAISAIVIVGAMLAAGLTVGGAGKFFGTLAVALAAVNVFGGFLVTRRMLEMFKKKEPKKSPAAQARFEGGRAMSHERRHAALSGRLGVLHPGAQRAVESEDGAHRQHVRHGRDGDRDSHDHRADRQAGAGARLESGLGLGLLFAALVVGGAIGAFVAARRDDQDAGTGRRDALADRSGGGVYRVCGGLGAVGVRSCRSGQSDEPGSCRTAIASSCLSARSLARSRFPVR